MSLRMTIAPKPVENNTNEDVGEEEHTSLFMEA